MLLKVAPASADNGGQEEATSKAIGPLVHQYVSVRRSRSEIRPLTASSYRYKLGVFVEMVGRDMPADRVRRSHVERFLELADLEPSSKRQYLSALRRFYRWAVDEGVVRSDPTAGIPSPKEPRRLPRALHAGDVHAALDGAPDIRARLVMLLCVQECLRIAEVAALQLGDVDFLKRTLYVRDGKGGHDRRVPISDETFAAMKDYLGPRPVLAGPLIRSKANPRCGLGASYLSQVVSRWMHDAGVVASAHPLRHTGATDMADNGVDLRVLQALLGHKHLSSTQIYTGQASLESMRQAISGRSYGRPPAVRAEDEAG